jgi:hypothetical protein
VSSKLSDKDEPFAWIVLIAELNSPNANPPVTYQSAGPLLQPTRPRAVPNQLSRWSTLVPFNNAVAGTLRHCWTHVKLSNWLLA